MNILSYVKVQDRKDIDGTQYYRQIGPLKALSEVDDFNITCMIQKDVDDITEERGQEAVDQQMAGYDIYAYPRMITADCDNFLKLIHLWGGLLVIDVDDDLTEDYKLVSGRGREFKEVLSKVDYVTTSTQALADRFAQYTKEKPTALLNCVDVEWMRATAAAARRMAEGLTLGFSGSPTHWGDWYLPSVPMQRICQDFDVQAVLHGNVPRYLSYVQQEALVFGPVPFAAYPVVLKQFDILLCAVDAGDPFNTGKSAVKALETMTVGGVAICSKFAPYEALKAQGAPVVIVEEDSRDGWYEAMAGLIKDPDRIKHLQSLGPDWVREHRDIKTGYKQWENFFRSITEKGPGERWGSKLIGPNS